MVKGGVMSDHIEIEILTDEDLDEIIVFLESDIKDHFNRMIKSQAIYRRLTGKDYKWFK